MRSSPNNPSSNAVLAGIKEGTLIQAIATSGYPLQGVVARRLLSDFSVAEGWDFIDDTTNEHRNLDIRASHSYDTGTDVPNTTLSLLIECKRSRHPFVFFRRVTPAPIPRFPAIAGIPGGAVTIRERGKPAPRGGVSSRSTDVPPALALGLNTHPFVAAGPPECATMSRATASGDKVNLSGDESFKELVLPLVKALRHALGLFSVDRPPARPHLGLCVAVLDAPMLLVEDPEKPDEPMLCPWVRVTRREPNPDKLAWARSRFYAIDVVHAGFLSDFITNHIIPFGHAFAERVRLRGRLLVTGGTVENLEDWSWEGVSTV
jgi:hypothetical protein